MDPAEHDSSEEERQGRAAEPAGRPRRIRSADLFADGARRVVIHHDGRDYVLIITKSGKLLLNLQE